MTGGEQLERAKEIIRALLRVVDRHLLSWSVWPEDAEAMNAARKFAREERD